MRKLIYTVNYDDYDYLLEPEFKTPGWDYICVTDNPKLSAKNWQIIHYEEDLPGWLMARKVKLIVNQLFHGYDMSIFIDAMYRVNVDLNKFIENKLSDTADMALPQHHDRHCVYKEIEACAYYEKITKEHAGQIMKRYQKEGIPRQTGLFQCGCMIRKHHFPCDPTHEVMFNEFNHRWYEETKFTKRDQISFIYTLEKFREISFNIFSPLYLEGKMINIGHKRKCKQRKRS